ncbi:hypothetical protein WJR50_04210 [Catalinimonas sp. 4WD22]|uniref:hypothetical protein n=1 Tax=Catalinimonas locisalis TaxID=3133978 RepID=UPI00310117A0
MRLSSLLFVLAGVCVVSTGTGLAQEIEYLEVTGDEKKHLNISISSLPNGQELVFTDADTYSRHIFTPSGHTQKWQHNDEKDKHDFEAVREGDQIHIQGIFKGEKVDKTVEIDEKRWINKLDHGLSQWVTGSEEELVFWTLKLSSDLDPIEFRAEKVGKEILALSGEQYQAIKVKLTLDGMLLSKLWSAHCWYEMESGLFLKFEGTNGGPGTPLTIIKLDNVLSPQATPADRKKGEG